MSLTGRAKSIVRPFYNRAKVRLARTLCGYDDKKFAQALARLGIEEGDALLVHASWKFDSGFLGKPLSMIHALQSAVSPRGLLVMTSMTYTDSSKRFLARGKAMDVRRSASQMGLITEVFRRGKNVRRSLSPTHPLLAWGDRADWFIENHEAAVAPFGPDSPFAKLLQLEGKILGIDTSFHSFTFTHFLEDRIKERLDFPLYEPEPMMGAVVNVEGNTLNIPALVLSDVSRDLRREEILIAALDREGLLRRMRVGNSRLLLAECRPLTEFVDTMINSGQSFFDSPTGLSE